MDRRAGQTMEEPRHRGPGCRTVCPSAPLVPVCSRCCSAAVGRCLPCRGDGTVAVVWESGSLCVCSCTPTCTHAPVSAYTHTCVWLRHCWWTRTAQRAWPKAEYPAPQSHPRAASSPASGAAAVPSGRTWAAGGEQCLCLPCAVKSSRNKVVVERCPQPGQGSFVSPGANCKLQLLPTSAETI